MFFGGRDQMGLQSNSKNVLQRKQRIPAPSAASGRSVSKPSSQFDKMVAALRKIATGPNSLPSEAKLLFSSILVDIGGSDNISSADSYTLANSLYNSHLYLGAISIAERFPLLPKFVLLSALCYVRRTWVFLSI